MLTQLGGDVTPYGGGPLSTSDIAGPTRSILVEEPPMGYWIAGCGYPEINGIYDKVAAQTCEASKTQRSAQLTTPFVSEQQTRERVASDSAELCYRHYESQAELRWVDQGWLLRLANGTDCFLQFSTSRLMVTSAQDSWQAIDSPDTDPLAEPPDEVVALLDHEVIDELKASQRAHNERVRRARNRFELPAPSATSSLAHLSGNACWWRVIHEPAVHVRAVPSTNATRLGVKLAGEYVYGLELLNEQWLRVHAPTEAHDEGWMLVDGRTLGLGMLLQRCAPMVTLVEDDGEDVWERLVVECGEAGRRNELQAEMRGGDMGDEDAQATNGARAVASSAVTAAAAATDTAGAAAAAAAAAAADAADAADASAAADAANARIDISHDLPPAKATIGSRLVRRLRQTPAASVGGATATEEERGAVDVTAVVSAVEPSLQLTCADQSSDDGHSAARLKSLGDAAFRSAQFRVACERYTEALAALARVGDRTYPMRTVDAGLSLEAILLCNRSAARRLGRQLPGAVRDASQALDLAPTYKKAALRHGIALLESGEHLRARAAFEHFMRLDSSQLALPWLQRCHTRLAATTGCDGGRAPNDLYAILDAPCDCCDAVLRQAYKRRSLQCHPDRQGARDGAASTAAFQQLQMAFEVLRDPQQRALYDFGDCRDWETRIHARYFPPKEFRPFARPARAPRLSEWDPTY